MLQFRILGPLEVVGDGGPVRLGGPKQRATLAILLLRANRVVSIERLADDLYAGAPPVTAVTQVQRQISELRKALGAEGAIETRAPGYLIRLSPDQLDLSRFERLSEEAALARAAGDARKASELLHDALALWRGSPLADLDYESFAQVAVGRLEEIRLTALEQRIEADLALGRHVELIGELSALVAEHPVRESLTGRLMVALYRSGRQTESLEVYRKTRQALVDQFGIEPTAELRGLEHAILRQDRSLASVNNAEAPSRAILVLPSAAEGLDALVAVAEPVATLSSREIIIARMVDHEDEVAGAAAVLKGRSVAAPSRTAVFATTSPADDAIRLIAAHDVDLVVIDERNMGATLSEYLASLFEHSPADLGILVGSAPRFSDGAGVYVPFGGGEHDWAALELAGWLASALRCPLRLVGTKADPRRGRRDSSRLLADASLAVQALIGVETDPVLAEPSEEGLLRAVEPAEIIVVGVSEQWRRDGIGESRRALVRAAAPPTLLVHRGLRPGGIAPRGSSTRFTWTLDAARG